MKKINYNKIIDKAMRSIVKTCLQVVIDKDMQMPANHHFYITFYTDHPKTKISDRLRKTYKEKMTIVLQHQFWGLTVDDTKFTVGLSFDGRKEELEVPYSALISFADPSSRFGLQFEEEEIEGFNDEDIEYGVEFMPEDYDEDEIMLEFADDIEEIEKEITKDKTKTKPKGKNKKENNVVSLDKFRK